MCNYGSAPQLLTKEPDICTHSMHIVPAYAAVGLPNILLYSGSWYVCHTLYLNIDGVEDESTVRYSQCFFLLLTSCT